MNIFEIQIVWISNQNRVLFNFQSHCLNIRKFHVHGIDPKPLLKWSATFLGIFQAFKWFLEKDFYLAISNNFSGLSASPFLNFFLNFSHDAKGSNNPSTYPSWGSDKVSPAVFEVSRIPPLRFPFISKRVVFQVVRLHGWQLRRHH